MNTAMAMISAGAAATARWPELISLNSRVIIEQAKGVLAQRGQLTMDTAFDRLRRYSRGHNLLLAEVAHRVTTEPDFARQVLAPSAR